MIPTYSNIFSKPCIFCWYVIQSMSQVVTQKIHVWYIYIYTYVHLVDFYGKCR